MPSTSSRKSSSRRGRNKNNTKPKINYSTTTTRPNASVYSDRSKVWSADDVWGPPKRGEDGVSRTINGVEYFFCSKHGWLTLEESPHTQRECKAVEKAKAKKMRFTSNNPTIREAIDNAKEEMTTVASKLPPTSINQKPGKFSGQSKALPRYNKKSSSRKNNNSEDDECAEIYVTNVGNIDGAKAKMGFGKLNNMTYKDVLARHPSYVEWAANEYGNNKGGYGRSHGLSLFVEWLIYHGHVEKVVAKEHTVELNPNAGGKKSTKKKPTAKSSTAGAGKKVKKSTAGSKTTSAAAKKKSTKTSKASSKLSAHCDSDSDNEPKAKKTKKIYSLGYSSDDDDDDDSTYVSSPLGKSNKRDRNNR